MTSTWTTINGDDLPLVSELLSALSVVEPALETAETAAETASTVLTVISDLLGLIQDPTDLIKALINELINDLLNNSVSLLVFKPTRIAGEPDLGVEGFVRVLRRALEDTGDWQRPVFPPGDTSSGLVFLLSAPSFQELADIVETVQLLFGDRWQDIIDLARSLPGNPVPHSRIDAVGTVTALDSSRDPRTSWIDANQILPSDLDIYRGQRVTAFSGANIGTYSRVATFDPRVGLFTVNPSFPHPMAVGDTYFLTYTKAASPPDWQTVRIIDAVPPIGRVAQGLALLRDSISPLGQPFTAIAIVRRMVDLLNRRVALLQRLIDQIQDFIDLLQSLGQVTNLNMLFVPPQDLGNVGFIREIYMADNRPPIAADAFIAGMVLYGGSAFAGLMGRLFPV